MSTESIGTAPLEPDAHGAAALLLVESLIHSLTARSVLSVSEAVEVMEDARDVQINIIQDVDNPTPSMRLALALLETLAASLKIDLPQSVEPALDTPSD